MSSTDAPPETGLEPTDPYERRAQIFPRLDPDALARIGAYGAEERLRKGTPVFSQGERSVDCFVVLEGSIEVFDLDDEGQPKVIATQGVGEFTGELDLLNDRKVLVSGRAGADSRVLRIGRADFRRLVANEPDLGEVMMRAFILRRVGLIAHGQGGVVLVGPAHGGDTLELQRFLTRNGYPHRLIDTESDAEGFLDCYGLGPDELPAVIGQDDKVLRRPTTAELADQLGLTEKLDPAHVYDVAIVGAGPGGLAAAVYAASEGLDTIVIEASAPGGQAGTSSKIENYLGFPTGISGQALAGRAQTQAQKFGARLAISRAVERLDCGRSPYRLVLQGGEPVQARAVVVASGARYRRLSLANFERFEGQGIHYAATAMEAQLCRQEEVIVVGGGNSAGQAAVFLSRLASHVHILVRGDSLAATMSDYLVQRIEQSPKITLHPRTEITALEGDERLRSVGWTNRDSGETQTRDIGNIFLMIGAEPNTDWLRGCVELDRGGFVRTGKAADGRPLGSPFSTTAPGVFAVGDARDRSVKRVASSVGEGSAVIGEVHRWLEPEPG